MENDENLVFAVVDKDNKFQSCIVLYLNYFLSCIDLSRNNDFAVYRGTGTTGPIIYTGTTGPI